MELESCLAKLLHSGYIAFGMACIFNFINAGLIDASKRSMLCEEVCLLTFWPVAELPP